MIFLISIYIPDSCKSSRWLLWDRRAMWKASKKACPSFQMAYETIQLHERIRATLRKVTGKEGSSNVYRYQRGD